jgi:hypothetical protein
MSIVLEKRYRVPRGHGSQGRQVFRLFRRS